MMIYKCKICSKSFYRTNNTKTCSEICQKENRKQIWKKGHLNKNIWRQNNIERLRAYERELYDRNKEQIAVQRKEYRLKNREKIKMREKNRYINDETFHFGRLLSNDIYQRIKKYKGIKQCKTIKLIGCSIPQLKQYLEKQFQQGMTWENHNRNGWHIDHIIGVCNFDLTKQYEQQKCFHYTNLQPLWAYDNLSKQRYVEREISVEV